MFEDDDEIEERLSWLPQRSLFLLLLLLHNPLAGSLTLLSRSKSASTEWLLACELQLEMLDEEELSWGSRECGCESGRWSSKWCSAQPKAGCELEPAPPSDERDELEDLKFLLLLQLKYLLESSESCEPFDWLLLNLSIMMIGLGLRFSGFAVIWLGCLLMQRLFTNDRMEAKVKTRRRRRRADSGEFSKFKICQTLGFSPWPSKSGSSDNNIKTTTLVARAKSAHAWQLRAAPGLAGLSSSLPWPSERSLRPAHVARGLLGASRPKEAIISSFASQ